MLMLPHGAFRPSVRRAPPPLDVYTLFWMSARSPEVSKRRPDIENLRLRF